ncbi:hypothetical protein GWK47_004765 [Chionoecetes opilio]|uniref:Uncharacterized protein n=1 Tax=Chionoecetes opilio TaxID=41210 RepID=A0A8J4YEP0_CHIOP|nr:hypothetical protein GWK47_004765 [Chionoecetes opilio]
MRDAKWELFLSSSEDLFTNEFHTLPLDAQADRLSAIILQAAHLSIPVRKPHVRLYKDRWIYCPRLKKINRRVNAARKQFRRHPSPSTVATSKALFAMHRQSRPASAAMLSSTGARVSLPTHPSDVCGDAFGPYTPLVLLRCPLILLQLRKPKDWPNFSLPALPQPLFLLRPGICNNFLLVPALPPFTLPAQKKRSLMPHSPHTKQKLVMVTNFAY